MAYSRMIHRGLSDFSDWLYADNWSKEKLDTFNLLYSIPIVNNYMDYLLDKRSDAEYMKRYQLEYSDIHDPRKFRSVSSMSRMISSGYHMISKNVDKLYD